MRGQTRTLGYFIVALGALFYFYEYFLRTAPSVMKTEIMHSFHITTPALFGTLIGAYMFAYTPMQVIVGVLVDKFSLRIVLTTAVICCTLGSLIIATSHHYDDGLAGRFLQGLGSAFAFVGALKLAAMWLPAERFAFFAGFCASFGFIGASMGEWAISTVVTHYGWRHSILGIAVFGAVLTIAFFTFLRLKPQNNTDALLPHTTNKSGQLTFREAFKQLLLIIKKPYVWIAGILSFLLYLPTTVFAELWGVPFFQSTHHLPYHQASIATAVIFIGWAIGAPLQGWISDLFNTRIRVIFIGSTGAAILSIVALYWTTIPFSWLCGTLILFGIFSSCQVLTFAMARDLTSSHSAGMAIAFVNTVCMLSGFIFQPGVGKILEMVGHQRLIDGVKHYTPASYEKALLIVPFVLIVSAVIALIVRRRHLRTKIDKSVLSHTLSV